MMLKTFINYTLNKAQEDGVDNNYQPVELELNRYGMKKVLRDCDTDQVYDRQEIKWAPECEHKGLINMMKSQKGQENVNKVQLMVCITMYNEPLTQLVASLNGVVDNLTEFSEIGKGQNNQIGICVFFDGIDHIRNSNIHKEADQNIIPYFNNFDESFNIKTSQSLKHHYKTFKEMKQAVALYNPKQLKHLKEKNQVLETYNSGQNLDLKKRLVEYIKQDEFFQQAGELSLETNMGNLDQQSDRVLKAMQSLHQEALYYMDSRKKTSLIYQVIIPTEKRSDKDVAEIVNVPIFFVFKHSNGKKLSSHLWFFKGFCQEIAPKYCLLMDGGAVPAADSIFKLYMTMETQDKLGGACGYMTVMQEKMEDKLEPMDSFSSFLNENIFDIQKCQLFEYHCAHILDKSFESALGFIHVLPGAFSIYRWTALDQGTAESSYVTLEIYLQQVLDENHKFKDLDEANMFLAEDRVLCLYIYCFKDKQYQLAYVPDAVVGVDGPKSMLQLMLQRRRWINGSWFALNHVKSHYKNFIGSSGHKYWQIPFRYNVNQALLGQFFQYCAPTFQVVWIYQVSSSFFSNISYPLSGFCVDLIVFIYVSFVSTLIYLSLTYHPVKSKKNKEYYDRKFYFISTILGLFTLCTIIFTVIKLITVILNGDILLYLLSLIYIYRFIQYPKELSSYIGAFVMLSIMIQSLPFLFNLKMIPEVVGSLWHYTFYQPSYNNLFVIYSFCRIDDLSWGTKGLTSDESSQSEQANFNNEVKYRKYVFTRDWIAINIIISVITIFLMKQKISAFAEGIIFLVAIFYLMMSLLKTFFSVYFYLDFHLSKKIKRDHLTNTMRKEYLEQINTYKKQLIDDDKKKKQLKNQEDSNKKNQGNKI